MLDRSRKRKLPEPEANEQAASIVEAATTEDGKNAAAVALGRLGGKNGGPARAKKLTKKRRVEIARQAAETRWSRHRAGTER